MQRFFCFFIIFPICIFSNWKELFQEKKDPAIVHHVDVTTGALFLHFTDHLSKGAVPLSIDRAYTSNYTPNKKHSKWDFIGGWSFFPHTNLYVEGEKAEVTLPSGREVTFFPFSKKGNKVVYRVCVREDQKLGVMSYQSNGVNDQLIFDTKEGTATLVFADGSTYFYRGKKKRLRDKVNPFWKGGNLVAKVICDRQGKGKKEVCYLSYAEKDSESDELLVEPYEEAPKIVHSKDKKPHHSL